jgi:hypothetical protein
MMQTSRIAIEAKIMCFGKVSIKLSGRCMEPFLHENDVAIIARSLSGVSLGDLVLIELKTGRLAVHRVVSCSQNSYMTKGDFSGISEEVSVESILGILIGVKFFGRCSKRECRYDPARLERLIVCYLSRNVSKRRTQAFDLGGEACRLLIWCFGYFRREFMIASSWLNRLFRGVKEWENI